MRSIYKAGVIGGGVMGADLALLVARQDMPVVVKEVNDELAERLQNKLNQRIDGWLAKGKIDKTRAEQLKTLCRTTSRYEDLSDVQLVIEAVPENLELKQEVFEELDKMLPDAILTSNTSSLPITSLAARVKNPERLAGMHFFNPPIKMPLVELVASDFTSPETMETLDIFAAETLSKKPIKVKDRPGFLVNVLLGAYLVPAVKALEQNKVTPEEIDREAKIFGWPMGPFVLLDLMGIDLAKEVINILFQAYEERFFPSSLVEILVDLNRLGQKTGGGFYGGSEPLESILQREFPNRARGDVEMIFWEMMLNMINESAIALEEHVATANDIETGCLFGLGFPQNKGGPLHFADTIGISNIVDSLGAKACPLLQTMSGKGETFFSSW